MPVFIGFIAALIILALVFRTVARDRAAVGQCGGRARSAGSALIYILTHVINVSNITPHLAELMVIGVGVDYALFIVTRHRRNLRRGMPMHESIVTSINTSGRAVLFAGTTVCIAILGLIALGVSFFNGMAVATALAVGFTMAASLTLLPALLCLFGLKVLPRKQRARGAGRRVHRRPPAAASGLAGRGSSPRRRVARRVGSAAVMIVADDAVLRRCSWAAATRATTRRARPPAPATT